jgi:hypothetical protein
LRGAIDDSAWAAVETEFTLPSIEQVRIRLAELMADPEPVMRQVVRVFIGDGTYCPGFQFLSGGRLHPTVTALFERALELQVPHNYFTAWMVTPSNQLDGSRPADLLHEKARLSEALETAVGR